MRSSRKSSRCLRYLGECDELAGDLEPVLLESWSCEMELAAEAGGSMLATREVGVSGAPAMALEASLRMCWILSSATDSSGPPLSPPKPSFCVPSGRRVSK